MFDPNDDRYHSFLLEITSDVQDLKSKTWLKTAAACHLSSIYNLLSEQAMQVVDIFWDKYA